MKLRTLTKHFQIFISHRPAISLGKLSKELDIDRANLLKTIKGKRNIPTHQRGAFNAIMLKYGYQEIPTTAEQLTT